MRNLPGVLLGRVDPRLDLGGYAAGVVAHPHPLLGPCSSFFSR